MNTNDEFVNTETSVVNEEIVENNAVEVVTEVVAEEPVAEVVEEPVAEVVEEPIAEVVEEPIAEVVEEPVAEVVEEPVAEVVEEPVAEVVEDPIAVVVEEPVADVVEEPIAEEPVADVVEEPIVQEPAVEVVEEPVAEEPAVEVVEEPVAEVAEEPAVEVVEEPVVEVVEEPVAEVVEEPIVQEPAAEVAEEPIVQEPAVEVVEEPVAEEPAVEVVEQPTVEVVEEPVAEVVEEPIADVVEEPVADVVEEPAVEVVEEPVADVVEEPAVEVVEEPVAEVVEVPVVEVVDEPAAIELPVTESQDLLLQDSSNITYDISEYNEEFVYSNDTTETTSSVLDPSVVPKMVFIVPYRDRQEQLKFFKTHMKEMLKDYSRHSYRILIVHQDDNRSFNRGAMKNIGFMYVKKTYPNDYRNITFVFNDVDTMPKTQGLFNYETNHGNIKHFYGFDYALGGIVSITGYDFERLNGFPNFWAWGFEDNLLKIRAEKANIKIDRDQFLKFQNENIIQLNDGPKRDVNKREFDRYMQLTPEGINSIYNISTSYDETTGFLNVNNFITNYAEVPTARSVHDLRSGPAPFDTKVGIFFKAPYGRTARRPAMGMYRK